MADTHHLGEAAGVIAIGLDRTSGQETLCVPDLDAHGLEARLDQIAVQPLGERTSLQAHQIDLVLPELELLDQRPRLAVDLTLPNELAVSIQHAHGSLLQRDIEANNLSHGALRSLGGRRQA